MADLSSIEIVPAFDDTQGEVETTQKLITIIGYKYGGGVVNQLASHGDVRAVLNARAPAEYVIDEFEPATSFISKLNDYHRFIPLYPTIDGGDTATDYTALDTYSGGGAATDYSGLDTIKGGLREV